MTTAGITIPSSNPKIAFFLPTLSGGGAEQVVQTLARSLADKSVNVSVLVLRKMGPLLEETERYVTVTEIGGFDRFLTPLSALALNKYLKSSSPDVIFTSGHSCFLLSKLVALKGCSRTIFIPILHNTLSLERSIAASMAKRLYRKTKMLVAVSEGVREDYIRLSGIPSTRSVVIYNPIDVVRVKRMAKSSLDNVWLQSDKYRVFLGVGSLSAQKDFSLLLQAFALVYEQDNRARLIVLGEGPLKAALLTQAESLRISHCVDFVGFVSNPYPYMRAAHRFVLSSKFEGFGIVLVEALAAGCHVISMNCPSGPKEILESGNLGVLVHTRQPSELAEAMLLENEAYPPRAVVERSLNRFSVDLAAAQYLRLAKDAINE